MKLSQIPVIFQNSNEQPSFHQQLMQPAWAPLLM
jgi:hypothetical protein